MGRERSWTRQYLYLFTACLIIVVLGACAPFKTMLTEQESRDHLRRAHHLMTQDDFEGAMQEYQKVLSLTPKNPPADAALFDMGLIHVHGANPKQDYKKARSFFTKVAEEFPESPFASQAELWAGILAAMAPAAEIDSRAHLQAVQQLMRRGDFEGAQQANQGLLSQSPKSPSGDAALFGMALLHIHYANPKKDYKRAQSFFARLHNEFPESPLAEEAKVWISVLEAMERAMRIDIEIEEMKKELTR